MKEDVIASKPKVSNSASQKELDRVEKHFDEFQENIKNLTLDRMNEAPKQETEQQTKLSDREMQKSKEIWLKPKRSFSPGVDPKTGFKEVFNEKFRADWEFQKEYVQFVAEHKEILGEPLNGVWTKPFAGQACEEWDVPVNKPVWGPRYLAEQIKKCSYHRLTMQDRPVGSDYAGAYYGTMVADSTVQRLDAHPVNQKKSVFMGASGF